MQWFNRAWLLHILAVWLLCLNVGVAHALSCSTWDDSNWTYRKTITIQSSQVTANLTNFPVLVDITDTDLQAKARSDGFDIYFTDSDGVTNLDHEVELYDSSTGHLVAWVEVPSVSSSSNTEIHMYYGYASSSDMSNATGVWDSNYETVWHLNQDPGPGGSSDIKDSTSNAHHGTAHSSMTSGDLVTGKLGKGIDFDGTDDYLTFGDIDQLDGIQKLTMSAWVKMQTLADYEAIIAKGVSVSRTVLMQLSGGGFGNGNDDIRPAVRDGVDTSIDTMGDVTAIDGQYHHWTMVYDGTQTGNLNRLKFYFDGAQLSLDDDGGTIPSATDVNTGSLWVGGNPYEGFSRIDATIDEVRTSTSVRSSDWIQTEYNNQSNPGTFYTVSAETTECGVQNPIAEAGEIDEPDATIENCSFSARRDTITGWANWAEATAGEYTNLGSSNNNYFTSVDPGSYDNSAHLFTFTVSDDPNQELDIDISVEAERASLDDLLHFCLWDYNASSYTHIGSLAGTSGTFTTTVTSASGQYTKSSNSELTLFVVNEDTSDWSRVDTLSVTTTPTSGGLDCSVWDDANWTYRKALTIQASKVTANLSNFPMLVDITDNDLKTKARSDGFDIYFTDSDGLTNLDHEVELYDSSTGHLVAWVEVPTMDSASNKDILMYYGNASSSDMSNATGVWDSNYETVWHMNQDPGPGGSNDMKDSTSNSHHGTAHSSMTSGDLVTGKLGKGIDFDGTDDDINFGDINQLDGIQKLTVSAWVEMQALSDWDPIIAKGSSVSNTWIMQLSGSGGGGSGNNDVRPVIRDSADARIDTTSNILSVDSQFHHWAMVYDGTQTGNLNRLKFYFDGSEVTLTDSGGTIPAATDTNSGALLVGGNPYESFNVNAVIDEVRTSTSVRSSDWIQTEYNNQNSPSTFYTVGSEVTSCAGGGSADHFVIGHDNNGIHCVNETITVTAYNNVPAVITDYAGGITLDTQSGKGTWSLVTGNGTFSDTTANDGLATYTYVASDLGVATFALSYTEGTASIDVDAFETATSSNRDDDTEGNLVFKASGFTVTASSLSNPPPNPINDPIGTQTAGTAFNAYLTYFGTTPTHTECGVIETYTGNQSLKFWMSYDNPSSGTVTATVDGTSSGATEAASSAQTVNFSNGQATVSVKYKDVGSMALNVKDATTTTITGGTTNFVVKPAGISFVQISELDDTPNPGTSVPTGSVFVAAGDAFKVILDVVDSEGSRVPNYGNEAVAEGLKIIADSLVAPAGGYNGSANDGSIGNNNAFTVTATPGQFMGNTFYWDEVGAITLQASINDDDYLGVGNVTSASSGTVGRFTPSYFDVALNTPSLKTYCGSGANGFTYQGQPFVYQATLEPVVSVTAKSAVGTTTKNYNGSWWRMSNTDLTGILYQSAVGTLDAASLSALPLPTIDYNTLNPSIDEGEGTITFTMGSGLYYTHSSSTPVAEFNADLSLEVNVLDADSIAYASNPAKFGTATPGNGMSFDQNKRMVYGRVKFDNVYGSDLTSLILPAAVEKYDGAAQSFVTNTMDNCTALVLENFSCTYDPVSVTPAASLASTQFNNGLLNVSFAAASATGSLQLEANLGSIGSGSACTPAVTRSNAGLGWLQYDWLTDGNSDGLVNDNPQGQVTYGIRSSKQKVIYFNED